MTTTEQQSVRADLVGKLGAHHAEMLEVVQRGSDDELRRPPEPGEWSPSQQIEHQILGESIWTGMAKRAAEEDEPDLAELWAMYRRVEGENPFPPPSEPRSLDELVGALDERHQETLALIESIPDEAFSRIGRNSGLGELTVIQMLRGVYRHYHMHIDQIEQRESSFAPKRT